jgi:hypothetical protein
LLLQEAVLNTGSQWVRNRNIGWAFFFLLRVLGENTSAHLEILPTVDFDTSSIGLVVDGVHQSLSANKKQICEMYVTVARFGFLFAGINFTDAHFGYQQFEDVFSFSCLLDVLNAYSSFLSGISVALLSLLLLIRHGVWEVVGCHYFGKLVFENASVIMFFARSAGSVFDYFWTKNGFQNGTLICVSG